MDIVLSCPLIMMQRIYSLDVARSIAILSVVISHSIALIPTFPQEWRPYARYIFGFLGVELFFVLSGFLIGTILIKSFVEQSDFGCSDLFYFWKRRWFRTLPNYFLFLIIYYAIAVWKHKESGDWTYLFFLQNSSHPASDFYDVSWSLCIEEWFYISFPILLYALNKILGTSKQNKIFISILFFIIGGFLLRYFHVMNSYITIDWDEDVRKVLLMRFDAIPYGVLAAYIFYFYKDTVMKYIPHAKAFFWVILCFYFLLLYYFISEANFPHAWTCYIFPIVDIGFLFFIIAYYKSSNIENKLTQSIKWTSTLSYSMYLIHPLLILAVNQLYTHFDLSWYLNYVLFWILVYASSFVVYQIWEKPIMQCRS